MSIRPKTPTPRYATGKAMKAIQELLQIELDTTSQDWTYIVANSKNLEQYLNLYPTLNDEDERFVLMEIMIQATEDLPKENFDFYWKKLKTLLINDFELHEYTIFYWCVFDNEDLEDCFAISGYMRGLWFENRNVLE